MNSHVGKPLPFYLLYLLVYHSVAGKRHIIFIVASLFQNADLGGIPHYEHDDELFYGKREQMTYNVEARTRVEGKYELPPRKVMCNPPFEHSTSKYKSSLLYRLN